MNNAASSELPRGVALEPMRIDGSAGDTVAAILTSLLGTTRTLETHQPERLIQDDERMREKLCFEDHWEVCSSAQGYATSR
jgi:hypothetical protein